jgi:hypothetical protein
MNMCPKCNGTGRYYTEPFAGVWKVSPCCQVYSQKEINERMSKIIEWCEQHEQTISTK